MKSNLNMSRSLIYILAGATLLPYNGLYAQSAVENSSGYGDNMLFITMGILAAVLLMVIFILSGVLRTVVKTKVRESSAGNKAAAVLSALMLISSGEILAQGAEKESIFNAVPVGGMHPMAFYALFAVILIELFVIIWMCLIILRVVIVRKEAVVTEVQSERKKVSFFSRFIGRKIFGVKPVESDQDVMLDHEYDGIRELDNDLPPWWKYGFYLTIVASAIYLTVYHVTHSAKSSVEEYMADVAEAELQVKAYRSKMALNVDETNAVFLTDATRIESGKNIYMKNCGVCHGNEGQGLVGPNFTDNHWLYGNAPGDMFRIVKDGTSKGMKPWKDDLTPLEIENVISYIHTLLGTNPPNPKAPEGTEFKPSSETPAAGSDSTKNLEVKL